MTGLCISVQQIPKVLPRLYLLILTGCCCIDAGEVPIEDFLYDLQDMIKGIQHPLKSILLRNFVNRQYKPRILAQKDKISPEACISFFISNLSEMIKCWTRLTKCGYSQNETLELLPFLCENIQRISCLNIDFEIYKKNVLPQLLEQLANCKNKIAQESILEAIINSFKEEFHLKTLNEILNACFIYGSDEDNKWAINILMEKLTSYGSSKSESIQKIISEIDQNSSILLLFHNYYQKILAQYSDCPKFNFKKSLELPLCFFRTFLNAFSNKIPAVNEMFDSTINFVLKPLKGKLIPYDSQRLIEKSLINIIDTLTSDLFTAQNFGKLLSFLPMHMRKTLSKQLIKVFF